MHRHIINNNTFGGLLMTIDARILEVYDNGLLVIDLRNNQEVIVNFNNTHRFVPGDFIRITFNGQMTASIPPQITATEIQIIKLPIMPAPPSSTELRAIVIQRRNNSLLVREINSNNQYIVEYQCARCFRAGQRIIVQYETIFLNEPPNPSRIIATDITSMS